LARKAAIGIERVMTSTVENGRIVFLPDEPDKKHGRKLRDITNAPEQSSGNTPLSILLFSFFINADGGLLESTLYCFDADGLTPFFGSLNYTRRQKK